MTTFKYAGPITATPRQFERVYLSTVTADAPHVELDGIYYPSFSTTIFGPTGSAKTLLVEALVLDAVRRGIRTAIWDEEMGEVPTAFRLRALGATDAEIDQIAYYPWQAPGLEDSDAFAAEMADRDLVVLDPTTDMLTAAGIDENANSEFTEWARMIPQRLTRAGIASLLIDGSPHTEGGSGSRQRGATQKGYKAALAYSIEVVDVPTKEHVGLVRLTCTKDRFGDVGKGASQTFAIGGDGSGRIIFERRDVMAQPAREEQVAENKRDWLARVVDTLSEHAPDYQHAITQSQLVGLLPPARLAFKRDMCQLAANSPIHPVHSRPGARDSILYWYGSDPLETADSSSESHRVPPSPDSVGLTGEVDPVSPGPTESGSIGDSVTGLGHGTRSDVGSVVVSNNSGGTRSDSVGGAGRRAIATGFNQFVKESGTDAAWSRVRKPAAAAGEKAA